MSFTENPYRKVNSVSLEHVEYMAYELDLSDYAFYKKIYENMFKFTQTPKNCIFIQKSSNYEKI